MLDKPAGPDTCSDDHEAMLPFLEMVQTILDGAPAMRKAGERYLPKFPKESKTRYEHRRKSAKFTNIYRDITENLAAKPFAKKLAVKDGSAGESLKALVEDIDGAGNHLHVFSHALMFAGVAKGLEWIFVDKTKVPVGATVAQERAIGARPYWIRYPAEAVIAVESAIIDGTERFVHLRVKEPTKVREGYKYVVKERIREFNRVPVKTLNEASGITETKYGQPTWLLHEKQKQANGEWHWIIIDQGVLAIDVIPLVPYLVGRRKGRSWQLHPAMQDAADTQIEHYQLETGLKHAIELTSSPMLVGAGIEPKRDKDGKALDVPVGANVVLYAPPGAGPDAKHGDWKYISPGAAELTFLENHVESVAKQMRELGRQPLTERSGNIAAVTASFAADKGNSAAQAWTFDLKDALELALSYTCLWLNDEASKPEVEIHTDFGLEATDGSSMDRVLKMRDAGDLDQETLWDEAMRRGDLSSGFDKVAAKKRLLEEAPDPDEEEDLVAAGGRRPPIRKAA